MIETTATRLTNFRSCPHRWILNQKYGEPPSSTNYASEFGTLVHAWLESTYMKLDFSPDFSRFPTDVDTEKAAANLGLLKDAYQTHYDGDTWNPLAAEKRLVHEFIIDDERVQLSGTLDLIVEEENQWGSEGDLVIVDHKTTARMSQFETSLQAKIYSLLYYLNEGVLPDKVCFNVINSNPPIPPRRLESGGVSKDKSARTTSTLYERECWNSSTDFDPDYLEYLQINNHKYFDRFYYDVDKTSIDGTLKGVEFTLKEMVKLNRYLESTTDTPFETAMKYAVPVGCGWCPQLDKCSESMVG